MLLSKLTFRKYEYLYKKKCIILYAIYFRIIVDSFYGKADLEQWLKPDIFRTDYSDIISVKNELN